MSKRKLQPNFTLYKFQFYCCQKYENKLIWMDMKIMITNTLKINIYCLTGKDDGNELNMIILLDQLFIVFRK